MKKALLLSILIALFLSCSKNADETIDVSEHYIEYDGWFSKEIVVEDNEGVNSAFYIIYSKTETDMDVFLQNYRLSISTHIEDQLISKSGIPTQSLVNSNDEDFLDYNSHVEPDIIISLITSNLAEGNKNYFLKVEQTDLKSSLNWIPGTIVRYEASNDFIGLVHWNGLFKVHVWKSWKTSSGSSWLNSVYPSWVGQDPIYYHYHFEDDSYFRIGLTVQHHQYQTQYPTPYFMAYSVDEFRGHECEIGSWDTRNCYVGAPPSGTTAFMYPDNKGYLYYTHAAGSNKCPLSGSWNDGHNCQYLNIPANKTYGFIWGNKWYVKGNKIL